jgi:hypothetical protein
MVSLDSEKAQETLTGGEDREGPGSRMLGAGAGDQQKEPQLAPLLKMAAQLGNRYSRKTTNLQVTLSGTRSLSFNIGIWQWR